MIKKLKLSTCARNNFTCAHNTFMCSRNNVSCPLHEKCALHVCVDIHVLEYSQHNTSLGQPWSNCVEIEKAFTRKNHLLFKNHLFWRSLIYIENYSGTNKDRGNTSPDPKLRIKILVANIWTTCRSPITQNLNGLDFDLLRSLGVKCIFGGGLPIHDSLFRINSNTWPHGLIRLLYKLHAWEIWISLILTFQCHSM